MSNKLDKVKVTNSGYLRICRDCKECVNTLTDLPTENVEKDTIYFVYDKEKYYSWTGTEWIESGGEYNLAGEGGGSGSEITIGENGNWFIDGVDTGQPSRGEQGEPGETGEKGEKGDKGDPGSDATVTVDSELSDTSTNPVQNKVITSKLNSKVPMSYSFEPTYSKNEEGQLVSGDLTSKSTYHKINNNADNIDTIVTVLNDLIYKSIWKTLTHNAVNCSGIGEADANSVAVVIENSNIVANANEIIVHFTQSRAGSIHITKPPFGGLVCKHSTYHTTYDYKLSVSVCVNWNSGTIIIQCLENTWGLTVIPVGVNANTIIYR